jgi:hypothetical protein
MNARDETAAEKCQAQRIASRGHHCASTFDGSL